MKNNSEKLILVVDDSVDNQALLTMLLVAKGYKIYCASNGVEALALLKELTHLPDLILLDAQMPIMDGYQFRLAQAQDERIKNIPVVVMTADDYIGLGKKMCYPKKILTKPLNISTLIESVSYYC